MDGELEQEQSAAQYDIGPAEYVGRLRFAMHAEEPVAGSIYADHEDPR